MDQIHQFKYVVLGDGRLFHLATQFRQEHFFLRQARAGNCLLRVIRREHTARRDNEEAVEYQKRQRGYERSAAIKPGAGLRLSPASPQTEPMNASFGLLSEVYCVFMWCFCLFITVLPPRALVEHISFSSRT